MKLFNFHKHSDPNESYRFRRDVHRRQGNLNEYLCLLFIFLLKNPKAYRQFKMFQKQTHSDKLLNAHQSHKDDVAGVSISYSTKPFIEITSLSTLIVNILNFRYQFNAIEHFLYNQMIKQVILVALALACVAQIVPLAVDLPPGTVNLVADNGWYLNVCRGCGGTNPDSASIIAGTGKDATMIWNLEAVGSQVAFKGSNGLYLSSCGSCWTGATQIISAFVHGTGPETSSLFTPELQANGKYAFKGDNGKYLARCEFCVQNPFSTNFAFLYQSNSSKTWAQWTVTYTNLPPIATKTLQADNGDYLKLCIGCGAYNAVSVDSGLIFASFQTVYQWNIARVGTKIALQASNGRWLSVCNNCWSPAASADSAFAHLSTRTSPFSQWTATMQPNGKWTLQGSNGKFLARCKGCAAAATVPNLAFVQVTSASNPLAQWTIA